MKTLTVIFDKIIHSRIICAAFLIIFSASLVFASEIIEETATQVIVREHPKTGKPYVSIVPSDQPVPPDPFSGQKKYARPDYRMLDPKIKSKDITYDGPYSDRKKIYIFAASLATVGTLGGAIGMATAPAAAGAAASGGSGAYLAGGGAVAATGTAAAIKASSGPKNENYTHRSESREPLPRPPEPEEKAADSGDLTKA